MFLSFRLRSQRFQWLSKNYGKNQNFHRWKYWLWNIYLVCLTYHLKILQKIWRHISSKTRMKISFFRNLDRNRKFKTIFGINQQFVESFQGPLLLKKWMKITSDIFFSIVSRVKLCGLKLKYKFRRENFQKLTVLYQAKLLVTSCVTSCRNFVLSTPHNKVGRKQITWPWNFAVDDNMQFYCFDNRLSSACLTFILSEKKTIRMNWDGKNYYRKSINKKVALLSTTNNDQAVVWN